MLSDLTSAGLRITDVQEAIGAPAPAGPIQWCDPASPLFDSTICYSESPHGGYASDPFGSVYDANYCAAQQARGTRSP